jgi:hypothetical protein
MHGGGAAARRAAVRIVSESACSDPGGWYELDGRGATINDCPAIALNNARFQGRAHRARHLDLSCDLVVLDWRRPDQT